jgi:cysteinyl-tRNA synthetase
MQRLELAVGVAIELRNEARMQKNYQLADRIRESLASCGIALEDTPKGTEWRFT